MPLLIHRVGLDCGESQTDQYQLSLSNHVITRLGSQATACETRVPVSKATSAYSAAEARAKAVVIAAAAKRAAALNTTNSSRSGVSSSSATAPAAAAAAPVGTVDVESTTAGLEAVTHSTATMQIGNSTDVSSRTTEVTSAVSVGADVAEPAWLADCVDPDYNLAKYRPRR